MSDEKQADRPLTNREIADGLKTGEVSLKANEFTDALLGKTGPADPMKALLSDGLDAHTAERERARRQAEAETAAAEADELREAAAKLTGYARR